MKCPMCGKGTMEDKIIPRYSTKIRGIPIVVFNAAFHFCPLCKEMSVSGREMSRWESILDGHIGNGIRRQ